MIRFASEMNLKIDPEILKIAKEDYLVREVFSAYCHEKPQKTVGYYLYKAFSVDKSKMSEVIYNLQYLDLFSLIFYNEELGKKTIESSLIILDLLT